MAESFDKFFISIDADVSTLEAELIKAQNELRQFQNTLKKTTDVGTIKTLNENIANTSGKIAHLNDRLGQSGKSMGHASQSLINFSRIAQDAPYGIMGIANNLNPMVESFQRLAKTEGGTKKALQAMAAGLIGPAGIGVAIGVVSSLAVTFSKEIAAFFKGPTAELEDFNKKLKEVADNIYKLIGGEQTKRTKGILLAEIIVGGNKTQQEEALKELKRLYSNSEAIKAANLGENKAYYQTLVNQAAMQGDAIAKEKNNIEQLNKLYDDQFRNNKKRNDALALVTGPKEMIEKGHSHIRSVEYQKDLINKAYDVLGDVIKKDIANLELNTLEQLKTITLTPTADNIKKGGVKTIDALNEFRANLKYELAKQLMDIETFKKRFDKLDTSYIPFIYKKEPVKESEFSRTTKKELADPSQNSLGKFLTINTKKLMDSDAQIKKTQKEYEDFANTISNDVSGALMGMYADLQQGQSGLQAVGNMLGRLAEQFVAAILQATIFAAIMSAINAGTAGALTFGGYFMKALGMADGGIVTGPTHALIGEGNESEAVLPLSKLKGMLNTTFNAGAMSGGVGMGGNGSFVLRGNDLVLALQRSNSSLNLRRGGI
ncbi:MAG: Salinibacter virus [Bacteroidota bacterium]